MACLKGILLGMVVVMEVQEYLKGVLQEVESNRREDRSRMDGVIDGEQREHQVRGAPCLARGES